MEIKWTITGGELLQIVSMLVAAFSIYNRVSMKLVQIETKIEPLYEWWQKSVNISAREYVERHRTNSECD